MLLIMSLSFYIHTIRLLQEHADEQYNTNLHALVPRALLVRPVISRSISSIERLR